MYISMYIHIYIYIHIVFTLFMSMLLVFLFETFRSSISFFGFLCKEHAKQKSWFLAY